MRRIISFLVIARLIQRLINGSRQPGGFHQGRGPGGNQPRSGHRNDPRATGFDEPPQGGAPAASDEPPQGDPGQNRPADDANSKPSGGSGQTG